MSGRDYYEEDEPVDQLLAAYNTATGGEGTTRRPNSAEDVADRYALTKGETAHCLIVLGLHYLRRRPEEAHKLMFGITIACQGDPDDE